MPKKHKEMLRWFDYEQEVNLHSENKMNVWKWAKSGLETKMIMDLMISGATPCQDYQEVDRY